MIDIHTHVLPHVDDGAKDSETAVVMLKTELLQGVTQVVLTPHYYGRKRSPAQFLERRNAAFARIQTNLPDGIQIRLGAEVHYTGVNAPKNEELCSLAIDGTKYILIEFPFTTAWTGEMLDKLSTFILDTGYTPIIAHAERYREIKKKPSLISELIHMGCLIQVNAGAFLDRREKKLAFALLKHGFVHCIGSDAHDMENRAPCLAEVKALLEKAGYAAQWARAQEIMQRVLSDEPVRVESGEPVKKFFGKYI